MHAIGLDIGTTTLSAVTVDLESGMAKKTLTVPNDSLLPGEPWARLMDPEHIWLRILAMLGELSKTHSDILCVGLTGQMHGILYADAQGRAVSPLFTWQDGRGDLPYDENQSYASAFSQTTGYALPSGYGTLTHAINDMRGQIPPRAGSFMTIQDYVGMRLTERKKPLVHASNAASFGVFDVEKNMFDRTALSAAHIDEALFPDVTADSALLGETAAGGLPSGVPVAVAVGDNQASFIGSVNHPESSVLVNMGTGGQVSVALDTYLTPDSCEIRPLTNENYLLVGYSLCGGRAFQLLEAFFRDVTIMAGVGDQPFYAVMNALLEADVPSDPLNVRTQFCGTRLNPELRGSIGNIGAHNFTPRHLVHGIINGMVQELYEQFEQIRSLAGKKPDMLIGSGNGIRQNPALRRAFTQTFGLPLLMPRFSEEAAYGASLFAAAAAGFYPSLAAAQAIIQYEQIERV